MGSMLLTGVGKAVAGAPPAGFAHVASTIAQGNANGVTTSNIDTTGANLIVIAHAWYQPVTEPVVDDFYGNTWTQLTKRNDTNPAIRLLYCVSPTVGSGHWFRSAQTSSFPLLGVLAFSGSHATPVDQESGSSTDSVTSRQPGSITPSQDNCLLVCGVDYWTGTGGSIDSGFTWIDLDFIGSTAVGGGIAYKIQTTAAAVNPTWSWSVTGPVAVAMASFKAA